MKSMLLRRRIMLGLASSPFSPEATAILKEDFPDYWEDIKAYGYANPQMVLWINEDPHLVCSLLDVGKLRWLIGDGESWINGIYDSNDGFVTKIRFKVSGDISNMEQFFGKAPKVTGASDRYSRNGLIVQNINNNYNFNFQAGDYYTILTNFNIQLNTVYNIEVCTKESFYYLKVDDTAILTGTTLRGFAPALDMPFFANASESNRSAINKLQISKLELYTGTNNDLLVTLVPFVSSTRNGVLDIHDLSNPTFYPNVGTGTFTTAESYYPYGEILPSTKASIIEDYGEDTWYELKEYLKDFSREGLVTYINNDYHMVSSLVTSGKTRANKSNDGAFVEIATLFRTFWKYEIKFKSTGGWIFGANAGNAGDGYGLSANTWRCGDKYVSFNSLIDNIFHSIVAINTGVIIDDKTYSFDNAASDVTNQNIITVHGVTTGSSAQKQGTCARFKIKTDSDVLVADLIPYIDSNDSNKIKYLNIGVSPYTLLVAPIGYFTIEETDTPLASITSRTRAIIIDKFGYEAWRKVRNYFNDESTANLVPYVNDDPDIVCSLVDIGYTRYLVGDGSAYIDTQYIPKSITKIKVVSIITESNQTLSAVVGITNSITNLFGISSTTTQNAYATFSFGQNNQTPTTKFTIKPELSSVIQFNKEYIIEINSESASMKDNNGNIAFSHNFDGNGLLSLNYTLPIFAFNNNSNTPSKISSVKVSNETLYENDNIVKNFIPCKNINGSDYGMLDIANDVFYPNANSTGSFTVSVEQNS